MISSNENISIMTSILNTYTGLPYFCVDYISISDQYYCLFDDGVIIPFKIEDLKDYEYGDLGESIVKLYLDQTQEFGMGVK